jgi:hypothetical protein
VCEVCWAERHLVIAAKLNEQRNARIERLETAVERATANMVAAQNRVAELEKALKKIASFDGKYNACDCGYCMICIAKEALEAKDEA